MSVSLLRCEPLPVERPAAIAGARPERLGDELGIVVGRQHDHAHVAVQVADLAGRFQPVLLRHPRVQDDHVRVDLVVFQQIQDLVTSRRLPHHLDVALHLEVLAKALTDEPMIIRDETLGRGEQTFGFYRKSAALGN